MIEELIHAQVTEKLLDGIAELARSYFRIEVEGLKNIPSSGKALVIPNHSGFVAADALMITHLVHRELGRTPKLLVHRAFFEWFDALKKMSLAFGLEKVSVEHGVELLKKEELVLIFPEGESGNFKSSANRYHLQRFHTGFIRMAIEAKAPIIPCLVIGAEESQINLGSIDGSRYCRGLRIPLPLNLFPLPSKWKIRFLEPVFLNTYSVERANDRCLTSDLSSEIQIKMQREINQELKRRKSIYF